VSVRFVREYLIYTLLLTALLGWVDNSKTNIFGPAIFQEFKTQTPSSTGILGM